MLAVDYRLAPESKFPAALDDAIAAVRWIVAKSTRLGLDPLRIGIGGDSAGGNLAAVMAIYARNGDLPPLRFQLLVYPVTDLTMSHASYGIAAPGLPVTRSTMEWFRAHYLAEEHEHDDWRLSPLKATVLTGVAPAFIMTAGYDPLADEGEAYATRLRRGGVRVVHSHYPGQIHGFLTMGGVLPTALGAIRELGDAIRRSL